VLRGLLRVLGKAEVEGAGEVLPAAVDAPRGEELLGADHAQPLAELVADQVLPAVAAGEGEVGRFDALAAGEIRDRLRVLVVRVRGDDEHARGGGESADELVEMGGAAVVGLGGREARRDSDRGDCDRKSETGARHHRSGG
jgi:hypothetical protein